MLQPSKSSPNRTTMGRTSRTFLSFSLFVLAALFAAAGPRFAFATAQQAPNSRVVLDLPPGYIPSPLFSGFQDDTTGVSYVILEAPVSEYDKMAQGFTAEELGKRGITDVEKGTLPRHDPYVYMRAVQKSEAGTYAKFFVLFRTADQTVLVSVNVPKRSLDAGSIKSEDIERVLAGAATTEKPAVRDLYALGYLGPFKEAGTIVGTSKVYTLDGRLDPDRTADARSAFMVAPSLDKRPVSDPDKLAVGLLNSLPGYKNFEAGKPNRVVIGGLDAIELKGKAVDEDDGKPIELYQALILGKDGGYFRLIGIASPQDVAQVESEFPKIAHSFSLIP